MTTDASSDFDLARFVEAQDRVWPRVVAELRAGRKTSHWMWFVFPQIAGLGHSAMSQRFAIRSLEEARAYLAHPVLGARVRDCVAILLALEERSAVRIFGEVDAQKLHSSLTLFAEAGAGPSFDAALDKYYGGARDAATLGLLKA